MLAPRATASERIGRQRLLSRALFIARRLLAFWSTRINPNRAVDRPTGRVQENATSDIEKYGDIAEIRMYRYAAHSPGLEVGVDR
jgi:hypothetical protein